MNVDIKDDVYYYSRYSNIPKIPINKKELFEYLGKMKKRLILLFDVNYAVKEETIGCGINIIFDKEYKTEAIELEIDTK